MVVQARSPRYDRRKPPPPDLPSLLFDQRIVYLGMPVRHPTYLQAHFGIGAAHKCNHP